MLKPVIFRHPSNSRQGGVSIRHGQLHDVEAVTAMHERCSEASLYRRFHAPVPRVSERMARRLIRPVNGWSIVAEESGTVVALACAAEISRTDVEVGVLVEDSQQRRGIGTRLLHELAMEASRRGYHDLQIIAQPENAALLATIRSAGLLGRVAWRDGFLEVTVPVRRLGQQLPRPA